ncbi:hypothetical protein [Plantactinospora sp. KLBMP9567]|uniref:hypothetical protein n=1 Tax=Plantactinospora sp. KLBMP9567 TaxID=3085900 RepID=UPI002980AF19|nr:hypothetical protein [Plantactinospora sp. KLBMP9567]MDW5323569.1 hypothetical protein [Plantactinospora sp. KLBMP9567]
MTALVLMGLLLGAGGARTGLSDPALAAGGARPAAESTVEAVRAAGAEAPATAPAVWIGQRPEADGGQRAEADGASGAADGPPVALAEQPSETLKGAVATDERSVATGSVVPTVLVRADVLGGQPDRPVVGPAAGVWPAGNAYARVVGPRAPPRD